MYVQDLKNNNLFLHVQKHVIALYIKQKRFSGDVRSNNEIVLEWIHLYSDEFRKSWLESEKFCN